MISTKPLNHDKINAQDKANPKPHRAYVPSRNGAGHEGANHHEYDDEQEGGLFKKLSNSIGSVFSYKNTNNKEDGQQQETFEGRENESQLFLDPEKYPLNLAAANGNLDEVERLLLESPTSVNKADENGW